MSIKNWMPIYWADYLADTTHLSQAQHGAYLLLIAHYWIKQGLKNNRQYIYSIAQARDAESKRVVESVLEEFFELNGDFFVQKRIEKEIERSSEKYERRKAAADKRWRNKQENPKNEEKSSCNADAMHMQSSCTNDAMHMQLQLQLQPQLQLHKEINLFKESIGTTSEKRFQKPTIEQVKENCKLIQLPDIEGEKFFNYHEAGGWKVGKNPMKNWKAAMNTWKANWISFQGQKKPNGITTPVQAKKSAYVGVNDSSNVEDWM